MVYGAIYADQLLKKSILPNFTKNLSGTWKLNLKACSRIQLTEKFKNVLFYHWNNFMQIKLSSLLPYPNNTIGRSHVTLLTNCILVAIFPSNEELSSYFRIYSKQQYLLTLWQEIKMRYKKTPANQPYPGYIVLLKQWLNMLMPCQHRMTHHLSKRCGKCIGTLRWCYRNLWMRQLVKVYKIIPFFYW